MRCQTQKILNFAKFSRVNNSVESGNFEKVPFITCSAVEIYLPVKFQAEMRKFSDTQTNVCPLVNMYEIYFMRIMRAFLRIIIMRYAQILKRNMFYASLAILVSAHFSGPKMDELYFSPLNPLYVLLIYKITKFYFTSESMRLHPCWLHSNSTHSNNLAKNLNRHAHSYKN